MGRPTPLVPRPSRVREFSDEDWGKLDTLCSYRASLIDCCEILGMSNNALERNIRNKYQTTFVEYRDAKMSKTRMKLVQKALEMAYSGDRTLMIFCLKNLVGWADRYEVEMNQDISVSFTTLLKDMTVMDLETESITLMKAIGETSNITTVETNKTDHEQRVARRLIADEYAD